MAASFNNIQATLIGQNATEIELSLQYSFNATDSTSGTDMMKFL